MVLNNLPQSFQIYIQKDFLYPEVHKRFDDVVKRMNKPYVTLEDFINGQIKSITFPNLSAPTVTQNIGQYKIQKRGGKELDAVIEKSFNITFKLTESYLTYLILQMQFELYLKYGEVKPLYFPPIVIDLLNDAHLTTFRREYHQITPTSLSNVTLSYNAQLANFNEMSMSFAYNHIEDYAEVNGALIHLTNGN